MNTMENQTQEKEKKTNFLDAVPPTFAFWSGVVVTAAVFSLAGFIILLLNLINGGPGSWTKSTESVDAVVVEEGTPTGGPAAPPTQVTPTGAVDMEALTNVRGEGDVILVEYSDTECPFCKRFHPTMQQVVKDYAGEVAWGYKHFPLTSLHSKAPREAEATECAAEQGKFWEFVDAIFVKTPSNNNLADSELIATADEVGLNKAQFDDCLNSGKYADKVKEDAAEAQALGGQGTPYTLVVDRSGKILDVVSGALPFDQVKAIIDQYVQ